MCVYLSELSAGLGVCRGRSAMQNSSTVNFPSFLSAPYIAITLPEREETPWLTRDATTAVCEWRITVILRWFDHKKGPDLWHTCLCQFCPPVWSFAARPPEWARLSHWCIWLLQAGAVSCAEEEKKRQRRDTWNTPAADLYFVSWCVLHDYIPHRWSLSE